MPSSFLEKVFMLWILVYIFTPIHKRWCLPWGAISSFIELRLLCALIWRSLFIIRFTLYSPLHFFILSFESFIFKGILLISWSLNRPWRSIIPKFLFDPKSLWGTYYLLFSIITSLVAKLFLKEFKLISLFLFNFN
jgi:hypothetical protein